MADLSDLLLRITSVPGEFQTKNAELTFTEMDANLILLAQCIQEAGGIFPQYDSGFQYEAGMNYIVVTGSDANKQIWIYVSPNNNTNVTPGTDSNVWVQIAGVSGGVTYWENLQFSDIVPTTISESITSAIDGLKAGVATPGDTLAKLYSLITNISTISNLTYNPATGEVTNSNGTGFTINEADGINPGLLNVALYEKLNGIVYHFKGKHLSKAALDLAHPTAISGDYATVDPGPGTDVVEYIWDSDDAQWVVSSGSPVGSTSNLSYNPATGVVTNDNGTGFTIPSANATNPGLMSAAHYTKVEDLADTDISIVPSPTEIEVQSSTGTNGAIPAADETNMGGMLPVDKEKVNDLNPTPEAWPANDTINLSRNRHYQNDNVTSPLTIIFDASGVRNGNWFVAKFTVSGAGTITFNGSFASPKDGSSAITIINTPGTYKVYGYYDVVEGRVLVTIPALNTDTSPQVATQTTLNASNIDENNAANAVVSVISSDAVPAATSYNLAGTDAAHFNVFDAGGGVFHLRATNTFDFEAPADAGANNVYNFTLQAVNSEGTQTIPTDLTVTVNDISETPTVPGAPTGLTATAGAQGIINLSWNEPVNNGGQQIIGYQIDRESPTGNGFTAYIIDTFNANVTFQDTGLADNTEYNYRVLAINSVGVGPASNEDAATTIASGITTPSQPLNLTFVPTGTSTGQATWELPASDGGAAIDYYVINMESPIGGGFSVEIANTGNVLTYEIAGLTGDTQYNITVQAHNSAGNGAASSPSNMTTFIAASFQTNRNGTFTLNAQINDGEVVTVDWGDGSSTETLTATGTSQDNTHTYADGSSKTIVLTGSLNEVLRVDVGNQDILSINYDGLPNLQILTADTNANFTQFLVSAIATALIQLRFSNCDLDPVVNLSNISVNTVQIRLNGNSRITTINFPASVTANVTFFYLYDTAWEGGDLSVFSQLGGDIRAYNTNLQSNPVMPTNSTNEVDQFYWYNTGLTGVWDISGFKNFHVNCDIRLEDNIGLTGFILDTGATHVVNEILASDCMVNHPMDAIGANFFFTNRLNLRNNNMSEANLIALMARIYASRLDSNWGAGTKIILIDGTGNATITDGTTLSNISTLNALTEWDISFNS